MAPSLAGHPHSHRTEAMRAGPTNTALLALILASAGCGSTSPSDGIAEIRISGCETVLEPGERCIAVASAYDAEGKVRSGVTIAWLSQNREIATVDAVGSVGAVADGQTTITASAGGATAIREIVVRSKVAAVEVTGCAGQLAPGGQCTLMARATSGSGTTLTDRSIDWKSSDAVIASVDQAGVVTGLANGSTEITARIEGVVGRRTVTVFVPAASVDVVGCPATLQPTETCQLTATPRDAGGGVLSGKRVDWNSPNPAIATVSQGGKVTAVAQGVVEILAAVDGAVTAVQVRVGGFSAIFAGAFHVCATKPDAMTWCWGWNYTQQLADGTFTTRSTPVAMNPAEQMTAISGREYHACGIRLGGTVVCWGYGDHGELGFTLGGQYPPTPVANGLMGTEVSTGQEHSCAITLTDGAYCWGDNTFAQLGIGGGGPLQTEPVKVLGGDGLIRIASGAWHNCGLDADGLAYCWGSGGSGQIGIGDGFGRSAPAPVADGHHFVDIVAGATHSCGLKASGEVWCWGSGGGLDWGIGDGSTLTRYTPVRVSTFQVLIKIAAFGNHTCGITTAGDAFCWGRNDFGQIGDGTRVGRVTPTAVSGGHTFIDITTGAYNSCGVEASGATWCWGSGGRGELGDGTIRDWSLVPTRVIAP